MTQAINTMAAKAATKVGIDSKRASRWADISLFLTLLTMVPYEKELMQIMPVTWTPYLVKAGMLAQIALRYLKYALQRQEGSTPEVNLTISTAETAPPSSTP